MKELLLFFIFLLLPTIAIAQFNNYEQDSKKLDRILANKDEDKAEILKESLNIMRNMLDATFDEVVTPENTEDLKLQLATYRILASIYKKTAQQIPLFKERIALRKTIEKDLAVLKMIPNTSRDKYKLMRKKIGLQGKFNRYRRIHKNSERAQRLLFVDIEEILNNVYEKAYRKDLVAEFIHYYSLTVASLDELKFKEVRTSFDFQIGELIRTKKALEQSLTNLTDKSTQLHNQNKMYQEQLAAKDKALKEKDALLRTRQLELEMKLNALEAIVNEKAIALEEKNVLFLELADKMDQTELDMQQKKESLHWLTEKNSFFSESNDCLAEVKLELELEIKEHEEKMKDYDLLKNSKDQLSFVLFLSMSALFGFNYRLQQRKAIAKIQTNLMQKLTLSNRRLKDKTAELKLSHKELHHRTKNNLQKIINLIYLKKFAIKDEQARGILELLQNELDAIALIHQKLYIKENQKLTTVNVADYVEELAQCIVGDEVHIQSNVEDIYIEMDNAVEIGLIINELVTNACKYGFDIESKPKISLNIYLQDEFIFIKIKDNGIGFPEDISIAKHASFGLMSIADLVKRHEHDGSYMELFNDNGAVVMLRLPFNKKNRRLAA